MTARPRRLAALLLVSAMAVPAAAQDTPPAPPPPPISLDAGADTDARIARRLREIMAALEGYETVTVGVEAGVVTLSGEAVTAEDARRLVATADRLDGVVAVRDRLVETADVGRRLDPIRERLVARATQLLVSLPLLVVALLTGGFVVLAGLALARRQQPWTRLAPNAFIADIYRQIIRLGFVVMGVVVALDILGATALLGTILGAAGIAGLALRLRGARHRRELHRIDHAVAPAAVPPQRPGRDRGRRGQG